MAGNGPTAQAVSLRLTATGLSVSQACQLLLTPNSANLAEAGAILQRTSDDLRSFREHLPQAAVTRNLSAESRLLAFQMMRLRALLQSSVAHHAGWVSRLTTLAHGYTRYGVPAPLKAVARFRMEV